MAIDAVRASALRRALKGPAILVLAVLAAVPSHARNGFEPLNHYGLSTLEDSATGARLGIRFKAKGQPVFLVHDPNLGLMQGDIMRFQDKAVLISPDVWQTLQDEGALGILKAASLIRVQAKATVPTWETRAKLVLAPREKKAYRLGAEFLKILEENFGGSPGRDQISVVFDGTSLVLLAPSGFLDQLRYAEVRKVAAPGSPRLVSAPPARSAPERPFRWQAWAVDPSEPSGDLRYSIFGDLPKGIVWNPATHALEGIGAAEGQWRLQVEARNRAGAFDTLSFTLALHANRPPALARPPKLVAVAGQPWTYQADAVDVDHEGGQVRVLPLKMPAGMEFDAGARRFWWNVPAQHPAGQADLSLRVEDPEGGREESHFVLKVISSADLPWTRGVRLNLPWDTLQEGKAYRWEAGASAQAWAEQGITLLKVEGPDSTGFKDGALRMRPMAPGIHPLVFTFEVQGRQLEQKVDLPVRPDLPPAFASELGIWKLRLGECASYLPVAVDREGEPVQVYADIPAGSPLHWDGTRLMLRPESPGIFPARLRAVDPAGHDASQWVAYKVEPIGTRPAWYLENRLEAGFSTWTASWDLGTGRLGIFSPSLARTTGLGRGHWQFPFLFFGGNLMGRAGELRGHRLWADLGLSLHRPSPKIATGGIYARLLGEWAFPRAAFSKIEFEFQGHVNQAILIADTSNLDIMFGNGILEFARRYAGVVEDLVHEATARDNSAFFTRLEGYSRLGAGFWAGPGLWREDMPNLHRYDQRAGGGLRYQARLGEAAVTNSLRAGWGAGGAGWSLHWSGRISLFSLF